MSTSWTTALLLCLVGSNLHGVEAWSGTRIRTRSAGMPTGLPTFTRTRNNPTSRSRITMRDGTTATSDGGFVHGDDEKDQEEEFENSGQCRSTAKADAWSESMDAWASVIQTAVINTGCKGKIENLHKDLEGQLEASAYASIWMETLAKCRTKGAAAGCAAGKANAHAQAVAAYKAYGRALATADLDGCAKCVTEAFAQSETTVQAWGEIFAVAGGSLKTRTCNYAYKNGLTLAKRELDCVSNIQATLWGKAIAGSFLDSGCKPNRRDDQVCITNCMRARANKTDCRKRCREKEDATAKTYAKVWLDVDIDEDSGCYMPVDKMVKENADNLLQKNFDGKGDPYVGTGTTPGSIIGHQEAECTSMAETEGKAVSRSIHIDSSVQAVIRQCKNGSLFRKKVDPENEIDFAKVVAETYVKTVSKCTLDSDLENGVESETVGCAMSYGSIKAVAKAAASGLADSWALAKLGSPENCNCKGEGGVVSRSTMQSYFEADLWADALNQAEVDMYGDKCLDKDDEIEKTVYIDCVASATVTLIQRAWANALVKAECTGHPPECMTCKNDPKCDYDECVADYSLTARSKAGIFQNAKLDAEEGYCTGYASEGTYYYIDIDGGYKVHSGGAQP